MDGQRYWKREKGGIEQVLAVCRLAMWRTCVHWTINVPLKFFSSSNIQITAEPAISANGLQLEEVGDFGDENCLPPLNLIRSSRVHLNTEPPISCSCCYSWFCSLLITLNDCDFNPSLTLTMYNPIGKYCVFILFTPSINFWEKNNLPVTSNKWGWAFGQ